MTATKKKNHTNKPLKWTTQRLNLNNSMKPAYRVHKRTPSHATTRPAVMTAETEKTPFNEIEQLERELAFTYDTVATITVHFESLHHAYTSSKPQLDQSKTATRLGEMEKELLTAYDDLGLQVTHLERKIAKLEKRLAQLKGTLQSPPIPEIASPCSSTDSAISDYMEDWIYQPFDTNTFMCQNNYQDFMPIYNSNLEYAFVI
ncbi:uncharacterized protein B0P05DRAFT_560194 [Gilbertella persicaria]|uniref:uncharacterized protein n=1 Tax=Gilbertella persicaria TaxID=101096 RepID=UPI002221178F|nr:uncharacterized protein B0P05DRAFT_560194 [Gilbertella persicaria]KAI8056281.1 hypothetical protein B0P05DRAFT_560194 [Gilbertella persicaria]